MPIKISSNFSDLFQWQSNYPTETKILDIGIVACSYRIRSIFGLNSDERILRLKRIRKLIS